MNQIIYIVMLSFILMTTGCSIMQPEYTFSNVNLIKNPSFENITNERFDVWITDGAVPRTSDPKPNSGRHYLMGSKGKQTTATYQIIDLSSHGLTPTDIDAGRVTIKYGGYQAGWGGQKDHGDIALGFLDENKNMLGFSHTGPFYTDKHWVQRNKVMTLPPNTRYLKYKFYAYKLSGTNNDGYLDDAFVYLAKQPIPVVE